MSNLFMILLLLSIIALIVGMVNPDLVLRFLDKKKRNRKYTLLVFGISAFISFMLVGITVPDIEEDPIVKKEENVGEDQDGFILSDDEKELLNKRYGDLDSPEKMDVDSIIKNIEKYNEEDKKIISENKGRIEEEKIKLEKEKDLKGKKREEKEREKKEYEEGKIKAKEEKTEYGLDEWWEVENQWKLKIDSIRFTDERNQLSDKEPEAVIVIKYSYENLGYEDDTQDLYMVPNNIIDGEGKVSSTYPAGPEVSAKPTPVGGRMDGAEKAYGVTSDEGEIKIHFDEYDDKSIKHKSNFIIPLPNK